MELNKITEWESIAKEGLEIEVISGTIYAFGSEIAVLRLANKLGNTGRFKADYSTNLKRWYFRVEPMA